jgi:transcriptional regulator with XRE-family HTH domain
LTKHFLSKLGARIRAAREAKGLSQEDVANEAGLERADYGRVERGEDSISVTELLKMAIIFSRRESAECQPSRS